MKYHWHQWQWRCQQKHPEKICQSKCFETKTFVGVWEYGLGDPQRCFKPISNPTPYDQSTLHTLDSSVESQGVGKKNPYQFMIAFSYEGGHQGSSPPPLVWQTDFSLWPWPSTYPQEQPSPSAVSADSWLPLGQTACKNRLERKRWRGNDDLIVNLDDFHFLYAIKFSKVTTRYCKQTNFILRAIDLQTWFLLPIVLQNYVDIIFFSLLLIMGTVTSLALVSRAKEDAALVFEHHSLSFGFW